MDELEEAIARAEAELAELKRAEQARRGAEAAELERLRAELAAVQRRAADAEGEANGLDARLAPRRELLADARRVRTPLKSSAGHD